jgi:hypothetical protein
LIVSGFFKEMARLNVMFPKSPTHLDFCVDPFTQKVNADFKKVNAEFGKVNAKIQMRWAF